MKYFLIAGEASGDLHASNLIRSLKDLDEQAEFRFLGGDQMEEAAGCKPQQHFRTMNFMGLFAVLANLRTIARIMKRSKKSIADFNPDAVILVDYAGFNLRIARFASERGWKVFYYISPKVWVWRKSRVKDLKKYVSKLFVIFPFEVPFFKQEGMEVEYLGNPLVDAIERHKAISKDRESFLKENGLAEKPIVALLAGSRKQEIRLCLPEMLKTSKDFPDHLFVIAGAPSVEKTIYEDIIKDSSVQIVYDQTYSLLEHAAAAVVTSGTATLETALFSVPQVVVYKTGNLTYRIGKLFVNFEFFSLVNLVAGREVVKELLQFDIYRQIREELGSLLKGGKSCKKMEEAYAEIQSMIGEAGVSERVASKMKELIVK